MDIFKQVNWIDIFSVIILFRIGYIAIKNGFSAELFKLPGTVLSVYLALHYYIALSSFLAARIGLKGVVSGELLNFVSFLFLAISGYLLFVLLRVIFYRFIKMDAAVKLDKWGGFILGLARAFLLVSFILFIFVLSGISYFKTSIDKSYSAKTLLSISPNVYSMLWNDVVSKFRSSDEKFNDTALSFSESIGQK